ncbi:ABC transporter substrate-binding protein [Halonotius pteroides]|uniref:Peptide ABC transporter substrate-binding protein n=1 Tax=Halonotius pteroides TaxID=268735 RepID=A0A3A6PYR3_9EURY|nr:ABC transporter substrate-binding protein [Halonotius pteroides]RJX47558.1 peptide ABC transporter substrate-binding protein [Halonotius pteroides]
MSEQDELRRRRFLQATGASALTASIAGCSGNSGDGSDGSDNSDESDGTDEADGELTLPDSYPYGANENRLQDARKAMEEAGYGPDNRFSLDWLQYNSSAWEEIGNTLRARLESVYIDMSISKADFGALLERTEKGEMDAFTLGWVADYPGIRNFTQLVDPDNTVYDADGVTPNGARLFWSEDSYTDPQVRTAMSEAFEEISGNPGNTDAADTARGEATLRLEKLLWESAALLPVYHSVEDRFWYDRVDYDPPGGMGVSRAKTSTSVQGIENGNTLNGTSATFNTLDPIASGNTASGAKIIDMFDALFNYLNATVEVEPLLIEDYTTNDDLTRYEFTLKEGVRFHGDYGELTADDVVYSIRRLVESSNSTNTYFPLSVLNIEREEDDSGNVVPGSLAVEATGDYSFSITLREPFGYALEVLSYSAFSVVPEGIVGDIEGYDGEMSFEEFSTNPVGCGPFVFEEWESGVGGEFRASAFGDYHGDVPAVENIQETILSEPNAIYNRLLNQNADISAIPTSQFDPTQIGLTSRDGAQQTGTYGPLENDETLNMSRTPTIDTYYIGFNMESVPKPVRQAMAYAMARDDFVESVFKGRGESAYHLTPPQVFPGGGEEYVDHWQEE